MHLSVCVCAERVCDYISSFPVKRLVGLLFPGAGWGKCPLCPDRERFIYVCIYRDIYLLGK